MAILACLGLYVQMHVSLSSVGICPSWMLRSISLSLCVCVSGIQERFRTGYCNQVTGPCSISSQCGPSCQLSCRRHHNLLTLPPGPGYFQCRGLILITSVLMEDRIEDRIPSWGVLKQRPVGGPGKSNNSHQGWHRSWQGGWVRERANCPQNWILEVGVRLEI